MKCSLPNQALCGTAVPVSALYSKKSCGVGEFSDLIPFADFCKKAGLHIIQLLPVNDTGTDSSPYNALSAFALHPLYICLDDIPDAHTFKAEIEKLRTAFKPHTPGERFRYYMKKMCCSMPYLIKRKRRLWQMRKAVNLPNG